MRNSNFKFRNISKSYFAKKSYPITIENNMNSSDSSAEIKKELHLIHVADRKAAQKVGNIVFDGNVSLDGFSSNDMILCIQNEANSILKELKQRDLEVTIDERALNSIISSIFFDKEAVNDRYYQSIKPKKNGDFITKKIGNLPYNLMLSPYRFLTILKDAYLLGKNTVDKNYVSAIFVIIELCKKLFKLFEIEINKEQIKVIIYIQRYGYNSISIDDLEEAIANSNLSFPSEYNNIKIDDLGNTLRELEKLNIIEIDNSNNIKIIERVFFNINELGK